MKECSICKRSKSYYEFGKNRSKKDGRQRYCLECSKQKDKLHYSRSGVRREKVKRVRQLNYAVQRKMIFEYLLSHPCVDCGESDPVCLDFDHVVGTKRRGIARMKTYSSDTIMEEISKCQVRCSNCHKKRHGKISGWYRDLL